MMPKVILQSELTCPECVHIPAQFDHPFWFYLITRSELT